MGREQLRRRLQDASPDQPGEGCWGAVTWAADEANWRHKHGKVLAALTAGFARQAGFQSLRPGAKTRGGKAGHY
eukprot:15208167-Alexandrium_andersonii.AAC.1